jgi:hypothetical protein
MQQLSGAAPATAEDEADLHLRQRTRFEFLVVEDGVLAVLGAGARCRHSTHAVAAFDLDFVDWHEASSICRPSDGIVLRLFAADDGMFAPEGPVAALGVEEVGWCGDFVD